MAQRPERAYHYRGLVERTVRRRRGMRASFAVVWREGYSAVNAANHPLYPWMTRAECRVAAATGGYKAVFFREGTRER